MTEQEIQALIDASLSSFKGEIKTEFTAANQGLASSLTKEIKKLQTVQPTVTESTETIQEKLTLKALEQQLTDLKTQLADKDKETIAAKRSSAVSQVIANSKSLSPSALQKLFLLDNADRIKEENGKWYVAQGESVSTLEDALNSYLTSEDGKAFLPASGVRGSDAQETKVTPVDPNQKVKAADALFESF
jgi:23S rRNA A1618 N6-methylase RlmF